MNTTNHKPAARFDDGIPECQPEEFDAMRMARASGKDATASADTTGNTPAPPAKPVRAERLLTCSKYPGKLLSAKGWESCTGIPAQQIYNATYRGYAAHGVTFQWAEGHQPPAKPQHVPKASKRKPTVEKPAAIHRPVQAAPSLSVALTGAEVAKLIGSIGARPGEAEIAAAVDWANAIRRQYAQLLAVLDGAASLVIRDGAVKTAAC